MVPPLPPHVEPAPLLPPERLVDLVGSEPGAYLLESGGGHPLARFTLAGRAPTRLLRIEDARAQGPAALAALSELCGSHGAQAPWPLCRHVGYLGYEFGAACDRFPLTAASSMPDAVFATYDAGYVVDVGKSEAWLWGDTPAAVGSLRSALQASAKAAPRPGPQHAAASLGRSLGRSLGPLRGDDEEGRRAYLCGVERVLGYIAAGDIYQANIARRFEASFTARPADLYRALRSSSPAPFAACLDLGEICLTSTSPERFLTFDLQARTIETRPIKGTRARGDGPSAERAAMATLQASEKDRAEHVMIVDLERSDLGRICERGSVVVDRMAGLETFAHLHHLVSVVSGRLREGADFAALLRATFPGGSITGAPKVRAMEIIAEVEAAPRGPCFGAFGWLDGAGRGDLALAIRTAYTSGGELTFAAGGGIVADSSPHGELAEASLKARAFMEALQRL